MKEFKIEVPNGYEIDEQNSTFSKIVFKEAEKDIIKRIKSFKDALDYLGEKDEEVVTYRKMLKVDINGKLLYQQMAICWTKALNEKHVFTEIDKKWRLWWNLYPFSFYCSFFNVAFTDVPLTLCFKNETLLKAVKNNKEFVDICEKFIK